MTLSKGCHTATNCHMGPMGICNASCPIPWDISHGNPIPMNKPGIFKAFAGILALTYILIMLFLPFHRSFIAFSIHYGVSKDMASQKTIVLLRKSYNVTVLHDNLYLFFNKMLNF